MAVFKDQGEDSFIREMLFTDDKAHVTHTNACKQFELTISLRKTASIIISDVRLDAVDEFMNV